MRRTPYLLVVVLCIGAILAGCNLPFLNQPDQAGVQTAAAMTVEAQLTAVAPATATFTPVPFPTLPPPATNTVTPANTAAPAASATPSCDIAQFIADMTIPDGTIMDAGETFTKTWRLKNIGTCTWSGYNLVFDSGDVMNGSSPTAIGTVLPGQEVDLSVKLTAPAGDGSYRGYWRIRTASGVLLPVVNGYQGKSFYVDIKVGVSGGAFAVTHVTFNVTGSCGNFHTTVSITTNAAGTVEYHKVYSDGGTDNSPGTLDYASAGTKSFSFDNSMSAPHTTTWIDIYIDSPNHQQFGRATYTCP